jgi:hypothetical protein
MGFTYGETWNKIRDYQHLSYYLDEVCPMYKYFFATNQFDYSIIEIK